MGMETIILADDWGWVCNFCSRAGLHLSKHIRTQRYLGLREIPLHWPLLSVSFVSADFATAVPYGCCYASVLSFGINLTD